MNYYYCVDGSEVVGPYPLADLSRDFFSGSLPPNTQVCAEGTEAWQTLQSLVKPHPQAPPPLPTKQPPPPTQSAASAQTVYTMQGVSELLEVYSDKVAITPKGVMGFLAKGLKGTKTISFHFITAIQFKKAGFTSGYLQFTIPGGHESHGGVFAAASYENSFMFANTGKNNEHAVGIKNYIESRVHELRSPKSSSQSISLTGELQKLANLRRDGILSDDEFNAAKKRLLNQ